MSSRRTWTCLTSSRETRETGRGWLSAASNREIVEDGCQEAERSLRDLESSMMTSEDAKCTDPELMEHKTDRMYEKDGAYEKAHERTDGLTMRGRRGTAHDEGD